MISKKAEDSSFTGASLHGVAKSNSLLSFEVAFL